MSPSRQSFTSYEKEQLESFYDADYRTGGFFQFVERLFREIDENNESLLLQRGGCVIRFVKNTFPVIRTWAASSDNISGFCNHSLFNFHEILLQFSHHLISMFECLIVLCETESGQRLCNVHHAHTVQDLEGLLGIRSTRLTQLHHPHELEFRFRGNVQLSGTVALQVHLRKVLQSLFALLHCPHQIV